MRRLFIVTLFVFLTSETANAQGGTDYRFLEVIDYANKPVPKATVKVEASCGGGGELLTDENGRVEKFPIGGGDCGATGDFTISKDGYYPFRDIALFRFHYLNRLFQEQFVKYGDYNFLRPFKVELLIVPQTKAERKTVGDEQQKRELFWDVADRDVAGIEKLLKAGINPNITTSDLRGFPGPNGVPAVIFAASFGGIETVKPFLKAGVNLRRENSPARDILLYYLSNNPLSSSSYIPPENADDKAAFERYQNGVDVLIDAGANINATARDGKTALMIASETGDGRTVKTLLDKNLPVNQTDSAGRTALTYAAHFNYSQNPNKLEVVKILLENGANPNLITPDLYGGCTSALMSAAANGNLVLLKLLLNNKADVNLMCADGRNALRAAVQFQSYDAAAARYEIIKTLIDAGADVNAADADGQTNLMFAVNASTPQTVEMLLKSGARINARDKEGKTALMKASFYKTEIVGVLLEHGANPNIVADGDYVLIDGKRADDCATALMHAAVSSDGAPIIEMLARHGSNINFACGDGETALTKAAKSSQPETVKKLLEVGADASGEQGHRALEHAKQMRREYNWSKDKSEQIINLLEAAGAKE